MTKHQDCFQCDAAFVGPDSNIGENLCPSCEDKTHAECREEIERLKAELTTLRDENKQLKEVDGLPTQAAQYVLALKTIIALRDTVAKLPEWAAVIHKARNNVDQWALSTTKMQLARLGQEIAEAAARAAGGE